MRANISGGMNEIMSKVQDDTMLSFYIKSFMLLLLIKFKLNITYNLIGSVQSLP